MAADDVARRVNLTPANGDAVAQAQAGVNAEGEKESHLAVYGVADGAELVDGELAA